MSLLEQYNKKKIAELSDGKSIPEFRAGDTVRVLYRTNNNLTQAFEGVCIARRNSSIGSTFTLRKKLKGEGVERVFPLYSPRLETIEITKYGDVRRAKLYYLRGLSGKAARIKSLSNTALAKRLASQKPVANSEKKA